MNASEHTPGPWEITPTKHPVADTFGVEARGVWVAKCHPFNGDGPGREEAKANAHLIAAAPELLEVCEMVLEFASIEMPPELIDKATAAIAKARVGE